MISSWRKRRAERHSAKKQGLEKNGGELEIIIPNQFLCPISLDLMMDPVSLTSGITFDRQNIEKWIEAGNFTCPVTIQGLESLEPIPNHAIRKMIQDWCEENRAHGIQRIPTPRIPVTSNQVLDILSRVEAAAARGDGEGCREMVVKLKALAKESERNRKCIVANGAGNMLSASFEAFSRRLLQDNLAVLQEILSGLSTMLPLDGVARFYLGSPSALRSILWFLKSGDLSGRRNAILALKEVISMDQEKGNDLLEIEGALEAILKLIRDPICPATTKASLLTIYSMVSPLPSFSPNENIVAKLVEMGLMEVLLEKLLDSQKSISEKALGVLDGVCSFSQGREKAYQNALAVPALVKKLLRVSDMATELSVSILWSLAKNDEDGFVVVEALQVGAFQKLLLLLQVGCSERSKEKATELLKMMNLRRSEAECIDSLDFKHLKRPF